MKGTLLPVELVKRRGKEVRVLGRMYSVVKENFKTVEKTASAVGV